MSEVGDFTSVV